jgi:hypothetical protein
LRNEVSTRITASCGSFIALACSAAPVGAAPAGAAPAGAATSVPATGTTIGMPGAVITPGTTSAAAPTAQTGGGGAFDFADLLTLSVLLASRFAASLASRRCERVRQ